MGKMSVRENKNPYQLRREELGLSRDRASELLESIPPERIERIENEKVTPHPDEILTMSKKYKSPTLCNHYCSSQCPIGQQYVPKIESKELSKIILEMLASLNALNRARNRLIDITADGDISPEEEQDFRSIQKELEKLSINVETLQLWYEQQKANEE